MLPKNGALRLFASLKPYVAYVLGCGLLLVLGLGLYPLARYSVRKVLSSRSACRTGKGQAKAYNTTCDARNCAG
jgi:hypothetical protein